MYLYKYACAQDDDSGEQTYEKPTSPMSVVSLPTPSLMMDTDSTHKQYSQETKQSDDLFDTLEYFCFDKPILNRDMGTKTVHIQ